MATTTDPIIVQIVDETGKSTTSGGKSSSFGGVVTKATGIANIATDAYSFVKQAVQGVIKPALTVIQAILKVTAQLLRPVIDMLMILLMPILTLIKPLVKIFTDLMRPFRQLAMQFMKSSKAAGGFGTTGGNAFQMLAMQTILDGFMLAFTKLFANVLATVVGTLITLIKDFLIFPLMNLMAPALNPILAMFGTNVKQVEDTINASLDGSGKAIMDTVNKTIDDFSGQALAGLVHQGNQLNVQLEKTYFDTKTAVSKVMTTAGTEVQKSFMEAAKMDPTTTAAIMAFGITANLATKAAIAQVFNQDYMAPVTGTGGAKSLFQDAYNNFWNIDFSTAGTAVGKMWDNITSAISSYWNNTPAPRGGSNKPNKANTPNSTTGGG